MSTRLNTLFLVSGLTIVCASCASTCDDEPKPHVVNVGGRPGSSVMTKPRMFMIRDGMGDAGAVPDAH
jgi:hypothetical protein